MGCDLISLHQMVYVFLWSTCLRGEGLYVMITHPAAKKDTPHESAKLIHQVLLSGRCKGEIRRRTHGFPHFALQALNTITARIVSSQTCRGLDPGGPKEGVVGENPHFLSPSEKCSKKSPTWTHRMDPVQPYNLMGSDRTVAPYLCVISWWWPLEYFLFFTLKNWGR